MRAVERFFHTNYKYELGVTYGKIPDNEDVITYFLTRKLSAHCEYFATGAAVLLRLANVPCRYVSGFVVGEKNGNYWLARNRHAHAWVEAYDDETETWITVEATPPSGVPSASRAAYSAWSAWWDSVKFFFSRLWAAIRNLDMQSLVATLSGVLGLISPTAAVAGLLTLPGYLAGVSLVAEKAYRQSTVPKRPDSIGMETPLRNGSSNGAAGF